MRTPVSFHGISVGSRVEDSVIGSPFTISPLSVTCTQPARMEPHRSAVLLPNASDKHRENFSSNPRSSLLDLDGAIETAVHGVVLKLVLHVLRGHRRVDVLDDELRVIHGNAHHLTRDHRESDNHGRNTSAAKADTRRPLRNSPGEPPDCPLFGPSAPRRSSWPRTWRPMRPKPLMPSFTGASGLVDLR